MWHNPGDLCYDRWMQPCRHWEHADTKRRLHNLITASGLLGKLRHVSPRPATEDELCRCHSSEYVARVKKVGEGGGGEVGDETAIGSGGFRIAALAAGGAIAAVDAVITGTCRNAYALVRPPGHHAVLSSGMGFCVFNNVAIAVHEALALHSELVKRVAIVDFDVHHGNGTQEAFYNDDRVLFVSLHQDNNYPQPSGSILEFGSGDGEYTTINLPLPPGSGGGAYSAAMDRVVIPALETFQPDLVVASCGFDASYLDPLGQMMLGSEDFRRITKGLMHAAESLCKGRLVLVHEGGYSDIYVPFCGLAVMEVLSGEETGVVDPNLEEVAGFGGQELQVGSKAKPSAGRASCSIGMHCSTVSFSCCLLPPKAKEMVV
ncbi:unnamed protein product [Discosporangium mesarthrocarpum]